MRPVEYRTRQGRRTAFPDPFFAEKMSRGFFGFYAKVSYCYLGKWSGGGTLRREESLSLGGRRYLNCSPLLWHACTSSTSATS